MTGVVSLLGRQLRQQRRVAEAAGEDAAVRCLLPVVEAVAGVVRAVEETLRDRLRGDHLAARGHDRAFEVSEQAAGVAVGGHDHVLRLELVERRDVALLQDLRPGLGGEHSESPHPPARLERGIGRVEDGGGEATRGTEIAALDPLRIEPVGT
jgi:hypothetical protein